MCDKEGYILQPYFTPMIENEHPELIKAREEFEDYLEKNLKDCEEI